MNKKIVQVEYCMLGYGYATLIAYHTILKKHNHEAILILQSKEAKKFFTLEHQDFHFSPLPIFPVQESELYNSDLFKEVPKQKPITVSFSELKNFDYEVFETKKGSLADFMVEVQGIDKNLCLGAKQWGEKMFAKPYSQVQSKIKRHYVDAQENTRVGYIDGKSLYKYAVAKLAPNVLNYAGIQHIALEEKEIHLENRIVRYDKLISTIPLHYLLQLCNLESRHDTTYTGCHFYYFKHDGGFKENQIVYDCDYYSDVIRIFSIHDSFLMVQVNGEKHSTIAISKIKDRVQELAPNIKGLKYARELYLQMCYPLEVISDPSTLRSISQLKKNDVIPFGRFGRWEYADLHELDWSSIV